MAREMGEAYAAQLGGFSCNVSTGATRPSLLDCYGFVGFLLIPHLTRARHVIGVQLRGREDSLSRRARARGSHRNGKGNYSLPVSICIDVRV